MLVSIISINDTRVSSAWSITEKPLFYPLSSDNILKSIKYLKSKKFNRETIVENILKNCHGLQFGKLQPPNKVFWRETEASVMRQYHLAQS